jgi:hypothetical protein
MADAPGAFVELVDVEEVKDVAAPPVDKMMRKPSRKK